MGRDYETQKGISLMNSPFFIALTTRLNKPCWVNVSTITYMRETDDNGTRILTLNDSEDSSGFKVLESLNEILVRISTHG